MTRPRLLYLVTEDWYFVTHRLPMARAARDAGFEIHVAARIDKHGERITAEGFHLHAIDLHRGSINPLNFIAAVRAVRALCCAVRPAIVHHIALQPSIIGATAARGQGYASLNAIFGFGTTFSASGLKATIARTVLRAVIPMLFNAGRSKTMVVNRDDRAALVALGVDDARLILVPGSGVDVAHFAPIPMPPEPVTVGYTGRMLEDKGVRVLVDACMRLQRSGLNLRLILAGTPDPSNTYTITQQQLETWAKQPGISWPGQVADVRDVWAQSHIAALASRSEGMPMSLAEAAACQRPLVATDVAGTREIARDGINALTVPPDDDAALAEAIRRLAADPALRERLAQAGRRIAVAEFSTEVVGRTIVAAYRGLLNTPAETSSQ